MEYKGMARKAFYGILAASALTLSSCLSNQSGERLQGEERIEALEQNIQPTNQVPYTHASDRITTDTTKNYEEDNEFLKYSPGLLEIITTAYKLF